MAISQLGNRARYGSNWLQLATIEPLAQELISSSALAMEVKGVLADVDTQKRHGVHERSSFGKE
jgi:hypothetical protein